MTSTHKFTAAAALATGLFLAGCKKDFVGINTDPNHITAGSMNFAYMLTSAELITSGNSDANAYEDWRTNLIYSACMIQQLSSTTGYWDGDKYLFNPSYASAYWDQNYPNSITDIQEAVANTKSDTAQVNLYNIARIFRAFMFQRMTDMYGDCPYSEAGLGYISGITSPKYDKQQDIYTGLLSELSDAAGKLDASARNTVGSADLLYAGDITKWKKFAYSEMVRVAMRMSKVDPTDAQKWVQTAVAGGTMADITDNALVAHQDVGGTPVRNGNGLVLLLNDPNASRLSQSFVNYLKGTHDPRLSYLGTVCTNPSSSSDMGDTTWSKQLGQPNGYDPAGSGSAYDLASAPGYPGNPNLYSVVNRYTFARLTAPTAFVTYGETELLLAEAAERGWIPDAPATHYVNGVTGSMQMLGAQFGAGPSASDITTYLSNNPYDAADALNQINSQYWVTSFMDDVESWNNWRRSGYPALTPVANYPGNVTNGTIPRRFTYPQGEAGTNATNYNAAVADLSSGDKMVSRMWWDTP
jgi:hypothetical protein